MPLIFTKEWWNSHTNIVSDTLQGMGLGWLAGEIRDAKSDRRKMIQLMTMDQLEKQRERQEKALDELAKMDSIPWPWPWERPVRSLHLYNKTNLRQTDPEYAKTHRDLLRKWNILSQRAMAYKINPLLYMPRSVSGDVAGTLGILVHGMKILESEIMLHELHHKLNGELGNTNAGT